MSEAGVESEMSFPAARKVSAHCAPFIEIEGRKLIDLSSFGFLGLASNPKVVEAAKVPWLSSFERLLNAVFFRRAFASMELVRAVLGERGLSLSSVVPHTVVVGSMARSTRICRPSPTLPSSLAPRVG